MRSPLWRPSLVGIEPQFFPNLTIIREECDRDDPGEFFTEADEFWGGMFAVRQEEGAVGETEQ
ncbi:hypothetical protein [Arthrospira platensis]|uniref:hypothetical protein n=1 Tax=Limnospira TaxID=2596745 RepID=UPI0001D0E990|nr:hypothetical protein [Arthrospira platensis]MBD2670592.1 hypothetical protein [Arthrospira platensis FACHB-439]MBD2711271.1 hypothetical protein [Arthrospira platensis FACHB-835]MDF2207383.1 hypothetical protein [Arthrospira platensis NCB002]MDT9183167.1 hypothetical protein [Limnospira sp. PMC 289.06]MDT9310868.1 hypothetical protein [Limnospira sp. Paracas R14]QQW28569.1 hypothetical protein AP9108_27080 [Arthrospira sp. PCC 9108]BAI93372.1 hypothetical protein NIES39_O01210 [Arthrospir